MTNLDPRHMTLEERSFFGLDPAAHVVVWRERERLARIKRRSDMYMRSSCAGLRSAGARR